MRTATVLMTVLLLGAPTWAWAQAASPATRTPEVFTATAQAKNATGAVSGVFEVRVSRYTPDFDRKVVEEALRLGGYPRFRHGASECARGRPARARRRPAVHDPLRAREGRGRRPDDRPGHRPARALPRLRRGRRQAARRIRSGRGRDSGGRNRARAKGEWRRRRACARMATAACCSTTTPSSRSSWPTSRESPRSGQPTGPDRVTGTRRRARR